MNRKNTFISKEIEEKYLEIIEKWMNKIETISEETLEQLYNVDFYERYDLEFTGTEINPCILKELFITNFDYTFKKIDVEGWQMDFSIKLERNNKENKITDFIEIKGSGICFELYASVYNLKI